MFKDNYKVSKKEISVSVYLYLVRKNILFISAKYDFKTTIIFSL
ncbi:hypothetical protein [Methanocaldococcus vulcanius]